MDLINQIILLIACVSLVAMELKRAQFITSLREQADSVWDSLGKPSGFFLSYLLKIDGFKLEKYIFKKNYLSLDSEELKKVGNQLFIIQVIASVFISLFFVLFISGLITFVPST